MKRASPVAAVSFVALVVLVAAASISEVRVAEAVTCNPTELSACEQAITTSAQPSTACCSKLREQIPCICGYLRSHPYLKLYENSPNAKKVLATCGIPHPKC